RRRLNACAKRRNVSASRRRTWPGPQSRICWRLGTTISRHRQASTKEDPGVVPAPRLMRYVTLGEVVELHRRLLQDRLLSKLLQLRLLCAFPDNRRGTAARRGRGRVPQLVTADGERPLLFSPTPIGKRGGRDLEG